MRFSKRSKRVTLVSSQINDQGKLISNRFLESWSSSCEIQRDDDLVVGVHPQAVHKKSRRGSNFKRKICQEWGYGLVGKSSDTRIQVEPSKNWT